MHNHYVNMGRWGLRAKHRTFCWTGLVQKVVTPAAGNGTTALMWLFFFFCFCRAVWSCSSSPFASTSATPAPPRSCQWRWAERSVSTLSPRLSRQLSSGHGLLSPTSPRRSVGSQEEIVVWDIIGVECWLGGGGGAEMGGWLAVGAENVCCVCVVGGGGDWRGGWAREREGWLVGCWGRECLLCGWGRGGWLERGVGKGERRVVSWLLGQRMSVVWLGGGGDWRGGWAREREGWLVGCWGRECVCVCVWGGGRGLSGGGGAGDRGEWLVGFWGRKWCVMVGMDVGAESVCVVEGWAGCVFAGGGGVCRERGGWLAGCWDGGGGGG